MENPNNNPNAPNVFGGHKALGFIHILFLFYSAAHNFINAWYHSGGGFLFFVFVLVGIVSVELVLWSVYKLWISGELVGKMLKAARVSGLLAMFYATAGILAQAQGGGDGWTPFYYAWILPTSAPVMFMCSFWIQAVNPVMTAERDQAAYAKLVKIEEKRGRLDEKMLALSQQRELRLLKKQAQQQRLAEVRQAMAGRRARKILKQSAKRDMPAILRMIGVKPEVIDSAGQGFLAKWSSERVGVSSDGHTSKDPPSLSFNGAQVKSDKVSPSKPHRRTSRGPKRKKCLQCGEVNTRKGKYCKDACSQKAYRERQKAKKQAA